MWYEQISKPILLYMILTGLSCHQILEPLVLSQNVNRITKKNPRGWFIFLFGGLYLSLSLK